MAGYDCHSVNDRDEIVIFDPDQILPFFVIHYQ